MNAIDKNIQAIGLDKFEKTNVAKAVSEAIDGSSKQVENILGMTLAEQQELAIESAMNAVTVLDKLQATANKYGIIALATLGKEAANDDNYALAA